MNNTGTNGGSWYHSTHLHFRMFKKELDSKENTFIQLRRLAGDLSPSDSAWITPQISGLSVRWEKLRGLSRNRDDKLARSKARAQDFADLYNDNVKWLNEAEQRVDAIALLLEAENTPSLMDKSKRNHSELTAEFARRRENIDKTLELGNNILSNAHSEAIGPLKQSLGALSAGWNELHDWMEQLLSKIRGMEDEEQINKEKLDKLLAWLLTIQGK